jgi:cation:H+ antiporter
MTPAAAAPLFVLALAVTLGAASVFARRLDRLGLRLGLPETLLGLLTALAADSPEVASALVALVKGQHGTAVGVVVGSNAFNIAAMLGVGALLAGAIRVRREALVLEAAVGLWATAVVGALVLGAFGPVAAIVLVAVVVVPYVAVLAAGPRGIRRLHLAGRWGHFVRRTFGEGHHGTRPRPSGDEALLAPALTLLAALALVAAGSTGMVETALDLADVWSVPHVLVGVLVLAVLTSLPNAFTGMRFARQGRGSALVSETLNSNSINLVVGVALPALIVGVGARTGLAAFDVAWLVVMTVAGIAAFARRGGPRHLDGVLLVALYGVFVAVQLVVQV